MNIGYDYYCLDAEYIYDLLKFAKEKKIKILHLKREDDMYLCYIPTYQRYLLRSFQYSLTYVKTMGLLKYILYLSKQYLNILGLLCFLISTIGCSYFIFDIEIIGTLPQINQDIIKDLNKEKIAVLTPLRSYQNLNDILSQLKTTYKEKIEYINVYQIGSVFHVEYTKRKQDQIEKDSFKNLYASQDALIESFDVDNGLIKVKKNDYVKKGDLLVENTIVSTKGETKIIPVKGHVYGYTFNEYEASVQNVNQDQADAFYQLLLMIRAKLPAQAKIDTENVLQITKTRSKIILKMHYTLIEDIAIKGENNEGSH